ncbi:hypothetical protein GCM10007242_34590 [Pigmentiphaga litoralis]|nr:hypothetical protein GCM10007242_34590 [Pigmentiphaga litoralis]
MLAKSTPSIARLSSIASKTKNKSAAGLGTLAHALVEGDYSVLDFAPERKALKIVAAACERPNDFFRWAIDLAPPEDHSFVYAAKRAFSQASWPWDKAFVLAGTYFTVTEKPALASETYATVPPFPYWVAIDKHTKPGKLAFRRAAVDLRISETLLSWSSFYFEGAKTNAVDPSLWWDAELYWRFATVKSSPEDAQNLWRNVIARIQHEVRSESAALKEVIEGCKFGLLRD